MKNSKMSVMTYTVSITSQGQLSIPAKVRRALGFSVTNQALLTVVDGKVILEPVRDLLELAGSVKAIKKPLSNAQLHQLFAKSITKK